MDSPNEPIVYTYSDSMTRYMRWEPYLAYVWYALFLAFLFSDGATADEAMMGLIAVGCCIPLGESINRKILASYPFSITVDSDGLVIDRGKSRAIPLASITRVHRGHFVYGQLHCVSIYTVEWRGNARTHLFRFSECLVGADKLYEVLKQHLQSEYHIGGLPMRARS